jgi:hypothetical protein
MQRITKSVSEQLLKKDLFLWETLNFHRTHENKPIRFTNFRYLVDIYKDKAHHRVYKKGTQSKISEYLLRLAIFWSMQGKNVLYALPTDVLKARYVNSRVDKSIEYTPYYKSQQKELNSTALKGFGKGMINFVGSNSEGNFAEFVAQIIIIDEKNLCNLDNIVMATERQASQEMEDRYLLEAANPSIVDYGIDCDYDESDQKKWYNQCDCGHSFEIDFFKHIVTQEGDKEFVILDKEFDWMEEKDCRILCEKCGKAINRFGKGRWVSEQKSYISGWQFNQFFTSPTPVSEQLGKFQKGLTDERVMQRFYNATLGRSYTSAGARITEDMMQFGEHGQLQFMNNPCLHGLDVNNMMNSVIGEVFSDKTIKIINIQKIKDEKDVFTLNSQFHIIAGIIDAAPEMRMSRRICSSLKYYWMCTYLTEASRDSFDLKVDRTSSLDLLKEAILLKRIIFPKDTPREFIENLEAMTRIWEENERAENGGRYRYVHSKPDDYAHGLNYMFMCLRLLAML